MSSANPKAFLCSLDGTYNFPILPKLTTIGREGCDIVINTNTIDNQHALIEYLEEDSCFILQDLNSSTGTFVNECRIQNSAVRLVEQDTIRFGFNGQPFQFIVQSQFNIIPPINLGQNQQQTSKTLQIINQTVPIRGRLNTPPLVTHQQQLYQQINTKPPSSLRTRPISAGSGSRFSKDFSQNARSQWTMKIYNTESDQYLSSNSNNAAGRFNTMNQTSFTVNLEDVPQGGQKQDSVNSETYRQDNDFGIRIANLEREIRSKSYEIKDLKDKLSFYQGSSSSSQQQQQQQQNFTTGLNPTVEMEQMRRDKSIAVGLVNTMQKDLNNKDITINKLGRDIEVYKRQVADREKQIAELEEKLKNATESNSKAKDEETSNREKELTVLNARLLEAKDKTIDLTNQILQIRNELEESQKQTHKYVENEKKLKLEIEHWKTQHADMQRTERTVRKDLDEVKRGHEKFRNTIVQAIYTTPGVTNPTLDTTDDDILDQWKKMFAERSKLVLKIEELKQSLNTSIETANSVSSLEIKLKNHEDNLETSGRRSNYLESIVSELEDLKLNEETGRLKEVLIKSYSNQLKWQADLETSLTELFEVDIKNTESLVVLLGQVKTKMVSYQEEKVKLEEELKSIEETHKQKLQDEIDLFNAKLFEAEDRIKAEYQAKMDHLKRENEEFVALIKSDHESELSKLREEKDKLLERIELILVEEQTIITERNDLRAKIENMDTERLEKLAILEKSIDELNEQIRIKEEEYNKSLEEARLSVLQEKENYNNSLETYREQIKQHSLTIINFEKEMAVFHEKEIEYKNKIIQLEKSLREKAPTPPPPPQPKAIVIQANEQEVLQLNKTIDLLRSECQTYKSKLAEQDDLIRTLRRDLSGASAKLSDVHGELTEKQKRELERNKQLVIEQQRELSDNRAQLAKLSEIVDKQTKQLDTLKTELSKSKSMTEKFKATAEENGVLCVQLREKLADVESQLSKFGAIKKEESKIANELTAIGAQCKGERHEQVISRQREALNELRQRVKTLETGQPATPLQQAQMQQQIILLKKQLAEMRASQAMTDDIKQQANMIHGNDQSMLMIEEKTAHHETQFALEASEETYLTLMRTLATILSVSELDGLRSMANLPPDERYVLVRERSRGVEAICFKIKNLLEKIDRQEALLKDYELDLGRLRQMEFLLNKKSEQLDSIEVQAVSKEDEINYLRESLKNTRSDLEKEKYLNSAIKQKKPIHTIQSQSERVRRGSTERLHHHCTPSDHNTAKVKKELSETIKRKDYELKTLKGDLKSKSNELAALSSRLSIVENSQLNN